MTDTPPEKRKAGRPPKVLTEDQIREVETLAAVLSQDQIADYFGMCRNTFAEVMKRDPDISERYARGRARSIGAVAKSLITQALAGNMNAATFYLKTQAGWREPVEGEAEAETETDGDSRRKIRIKFNMG
jgi:hypothetical protein